ncbi:MAG: hypothetical protein ACP6IS_05190 [Candidatus Asgardarchaeia archaeon]
MKINNDNKKDQISGNSQISKFSNNTILMLNFLSSHYELISTLSIISLVSIITIFLSLPFYLPLLATALYVFLIKSLSTLSKSEKLPSILAPAYRIEVLVRCNKCEYKEIRKFERGFYVFKQLGTCPSCNEGKIYIHSIYGIPLHPSEEEKEEEKI